MILGSNQSYQELLQSFPPRLITSEEQFWATQEVIDALIDKGDLTPDEQEFLNLLGTLVYLYEEDSVRIPELRGVPLIKALLSERNLHHTDLVPIFKTESIVHALFNGHHQLTTSEIEKLAEFFSLPSDLFFDPTPTSAKNEPFVSATFLPPAGQERMAVLSSHMS